MSCNCANILIKRHCLKCQTTWMEEMSDMEKIIQQEQCDEHKEDIRAHIDGGILRLCDECDKVWVIGPQSGFFDMPEIIRKDVSE